MTTILILGFLIGMRHALDADHVAAVASLIVSKKSVRSSVWQGAIWGVGHTLTLFMIGAIVLLSETSVSPTVPRLLEAAVGAMLVFLGLEVARTIFRENIHFHAHSHDDGVRHVHAHRHDDWSESHDESDHEHTHADPFPRRALAVGLMHGLAGSAALIVLAIDATQPVWEGLAYILLFGLGSIAGMAALSVAIAIPITRSNRFSKNYHRAAQIAVSAANIGIGGTLVYRV